MTSDQRRESQASPGPDPVSPEPGSPLPALRDCATLLVSCADRHGLVASLAQVLTGHGANILAADQHRNEQVGQFFQRIRFDVSELLTDRGTLERALNEVAQRFGMDLRLFYDSDVPRVAIFVSQYDHCLYDCCGDIGAESYLARSRSSSAIGTTWHRSPSR